MKEIKEEYYILETALLILNGTSDSELLLKYHLGKYINRGKKLVEILKVLTKQ